MTTALQPQIFEAPLVNPAPTGLYGVTSWADQGEPYRWLAAGMEIRSHNYGGEAAFGVWGADWCAHDADLSPADVKEGERPEFLAPFKAFTVWAEDHCDLTVPSQTEIIIRAQQNMRLLEQNAVEREFATRMLLDAGGAPSVSGLVAAVGELEEAFAETNTLGLIHARPSLAAVAAQALLLSGSGKSPMGHRWVFGGGYAAGLGNKLVATSPTYGWRGEVTTRTTTKPEWNRFSAIAERSLLVGYESLIGAVTVN
jgi:hypothetical protein